MVRSEELERVGERRMGEKVFCVFVFFFVFSDWEFDIDYIFNCFCGNYVNWVFLYFVLVLFK